MHSNNIAPKNGKITVIDHLSANRCANSEKKIKNPIGLGQFYLIVDPN